jgi:hypothetical protein
MCGQLDLEVISKTLTKKKNHHLLFMSFVVTDFKIKKPKNKILQSLDVIILWIS